MFVLKHLETVHPFATEPVCSLGNTYKLQAIINLIQLLISAGLFVSSAHVEGLSLSQRCINNYGPLWTFLNICATLYIHIAFQTARNMTEYQGPLWLSHSQDLLEYLASWLVSCLP